MKKQSNKNKHNVSISSPARLHLGFYGLNNKYGYSFGSMGLAINSYKTKIHICPSSSFKSNLPNKYILGVKKILNKFNLKSNFNISLIDQPSNHIGLGSGTQLALSTGALLSEYFQLSLSTKEIVKIFRRGERSGTGIGVFDKGGFILDSCKKNNKIPEILVRAKFPSNWKIIIINDSQLKGVSGNKESSFFTNNKSSETYADKLTHLLLRGILPAITYKDFKNFAANLTEFQRTTSFFYKNSQKSMFLSPEISKIMKYLKNSSHLGLGQSSWGPVSYIFTESIITAKETINVIENKFNVYNNLTYKIVSPRNSGHKIKYN